MTDTLAEHLNAIASSECYRTDAILKQNPFETTELVYFQGINGAELGPFVRKRIVCNEGIGNAYEKVFAAEQMGIRFRYLPRIIDYHIEDSEQIVVMEHIKGETLADAVGKHDHSSSFAAALFPRLCDAVEELHTSLDEPLIHRDLKPSNIMVSHDTPIIIDLGIARAFKTTAEEDTRHFGTRTFAPPEQFGFGQTDSRTDIYALGMLLAFCLTGEIPNQNIWKNGFAHTEIPKPIRQVIVRATAFDPNKRYSTTSELKQAFIAAASICGITPPEKAANSFDKARQTCKRTLGKIPLPLGVAWDVLLAVVFAIACMGATGQTINPPETSSAATLPFAFRAIANGSAVGLILGPILFSISDRRPIARIFPSFASVPLERDMSACLVLILTGIFLVCVITRF